MVAIRVQWAPNRTWPVSLVSGTARTHVNTAFLSQRSQNGGRRKNQNRRLPSASSSARLRRLHLEALEHRSMMPVVAHGIQSIQAAEGVVLNTVLLAQFTDPLGTLP